MFPTRLRCLRNDKKVSQQKIADFLGITRQGYGKYEDGKSEPDHKTLLKLANYFNVTTDYLLGKSDLPNLTENEEVDSIEELKQFVEELGIKDLFFHNIDELKSLSREDIEEMRRDIEYTLRKAKRRKED